MTRVSKDPQVRIAEILDTAEMLFHKQGYHETAVSDIVKQIGVAQGTFYYYFKSKEEVLEAIVWRHMTKIFADTEGVTNTDNVAATRKIELVFHTLFKSIRCGDELLFDFLYTDEYLHLLDKFGRQGQKLLTPLLLKIVEDGRQEGTFHVSHPKETVDFIRAIIDSLFEALYEKNTEDSMIYRAQIAGRLLEKVLGMAEGTLQIKL